MTMRRLLGTVLPALVLAGALTACGDDSGSGADDPSPTASPSSSPSSSLSSSPTKGTTGDAVGFELVDLITETAAGGQVEAGAAAVPLSDDTAVQEFTAQFTSDALPTRVQEAADGATVPDDMLLYGAVVAIGCDTPGQVSVTSSDQGLVITEHKVPSPQLECFAPMTTVALVRVPASAVS